MEKTFAFGPLYKRGIFLTAVMSTARAKYQSFSETQFIIKLYHASTNLNNQSGIVLALLSGSLFALKNIWIFWKTVQLLLRRYYSQSQSDTSCCRKVLNLVFQLEDYRGEKRSSTYHINQVYESSLILEFNSVSDLLSIITPYDVVRLPKCWLNCLSWCRSNKAATQVNNSKEPDRYIDRRIAYLIFKIILEDICRTVLKIFAIVIAFK